MTKKSRKTYQCDPDFKELEINIEGLCVDFDVDPEVITEEQYGVKMDFHPNSYLWQETDEMKPVKNIFNVEQF